jgi:hypothetical protein
MLWLFGYGRARSGAVSQKGGTVYSRMACSFEVVCTTAEQQSNNEPEKTENG